MVTPWHCLPDSHQIVRAKRTVPNEAHKSDAALIARYCSAMQPRLWEPPSPSQRRLQRLGRRRTALVEMRTQEHNRLEGPGIQEIRDSLQIMIEFLEQQIADIDREIASVIDDDPDLRVARRVATDHRVSQRQGARRIRQPLRSRVPIRIVGIGVMAFQSRQRARSPRALHAGDHLHALHPVLIDFAARLRGAASAPSRSSLPSCVGCSSSPTECSSRVAPSMPLWPLDAGHGI